MSLRRIRFGSAARSRPHSDDGKNALWFFFYREQYVVPTPACPEPIVYWEVLADETEPRELRYQLQQAGRAVPGRVARPQRYSVASPPDSLRGVPAIQPGLPFVWFLDAWSSNVRSYRGWARLPGGYGVWTNVLVVQHAIVMRIRQEPADGTG